MAITEIQDIEETKASGSGTGGGSGSGKGTTDDEAEINEIDKNVKDQINA